MSDHQHDELWNYIEGLREDLGQAEERIHDALERIRALEAEHEADVKREEWELREADEPEPAPYDPGPEVDDEGGMSEYRGWLP